MTWWQLSLLGVGCTIGTGFFLGSSLSIEKSGPAVLIPFILAAVGTYIVYDALAEMSADHPVEGSFRSYAKEAFGRWAGFSNGWMYWISEVLIMGSQLIALAIFTQFWFPDIPLWIFASIYSVLGLLVLLTGMHGFERIENIFGVVKTAAIFMFIIMAVIVIWKSGGEAGKGEVFSKNYGNFFSEGITGIWLALLYAFYAYGGIEVMGLLAIDLKDPAEAPRSGRVMIITLTAIYVASIGLALALISWEKFHTKESPFITALKPYDLPYVAHLLNGILIIAGFSTMVAALYAVITMLMTLADDQDAPSFLNKKGKWKVPVPAFLFTAGGLLLSVVIALLLPEKIFEYITTAAGLMLLYNWLFILCTHWKLMKLSAWRRLKNIVGMILIAAAVSGTLGEQMSRPGLYVSLLFLVIIGVATMIMRKKWRKAENAS
jgi:L-asparagine transporter-like permease